MRVGQQQIMFPHLINAIESGDNNHTLVIMQETPDTWTSDCRVFMSLQEDHNDILYDSQTHHWEFIKDSST